MSTRLPQTNCRILIIDDNRSIHEDFRKILAPSKEKPALSDLRAELFGEEAARPEEASFEIASAYQGQEGLAVVADAISKGTPFAMAFVDVRMPPGWDGIETITRIWVVDPDIQVVLCTAYSDYSWTEMMVKLGHPDRLVILKKPFDPIEALQLAHALTKKWMLLKATQQKMAELEEIVHYRTLNLKKTNDSLQREIELRKRREHCLTLQQRVTSVLAEFSGSSDEMTSKLLAILCEGMEWDFAQLWMVDEPACCLRPANRWHRRSPELEVFERVMRQLTLSSGHDLSGQVWKTGQPVWVADIAGAGNFPRAKVAAAAGLHAAFAFPLRLQGKILGVIEFLSAKVRQPEEDLLQLFATMGSLMGQALERRMLETHLRQSQKMDAIGQLAGGVAHDFNNMLTVIQGFVQILQLQSAANKEFTDGLNQIGMAATRAANLTRQLLAFSRKQIIQPATLDLNNVINNLYKMLVRLIGEDIALSLNYSPTPALVSADEDMLSQVLINLSVNSRDAMAKGGQLVISTEFFTVAQDNLSANSSGRPGDFVCLTVTDSGCGIPPEVLPHIFEPFFTTKDVGRGTGLGLSTVYGIVEQHRGWIEVNSRVGVGTVFRIYLPRVKAAELRPDQQHADANLPKGTETILLVEDEDAVRSVASILLKRLGYKVIEAGSGKAALAIWEEHSTGIDLVLTDMVMPDGISGRDLVAELRSRNPEVKCIFASGYNPFQNEENEDLIEGVNFLQKPYHAHKLGEVIRRMLDREEKVIVHI